MDGPKEIGEGNCAINVIFIMNFNFLNKSKNVKKKFLYF